MAQIDERKETPKESSDDLLKDAEVLLRDALDRAHDAAAGLRQAEERLLQAGGPLAQMDRQRRLEDRSQRAEERLRRTEEKLRQAAEVVAELEDRRRQAEERIQQLAAARRESEEKLAQSEDRIREAQRSAKLAEERSRAAERRTKETETSLSQAVEKLRQTAQHLGELEERRKKADERAREAEERAAALSDRLRQAEKRAGSMEGILAETESRVRAAEVEFRVASERLLAAESRNRDPDPADIARQLARFDYEATAGNGETTATREAPENAPDIAAELGPDPMATLRDALARSQANRMWEPGEEDITPVGSETTADAPVAPTSSSESGALAAASVDDAASSEGRAATPGKDRNEPGSGSWTEPAPATTSADGDPAAENDDAPREYGDEETLSVTERELRQYAEQRSEFEERLREFWKDAEGERSADAEEEERRFRLWRRDRGE
jgi:hypothetical protein